MSDFAHHLDDEDAVLAAAIEYGGATAITVASLTADELQRPQNRAVLAGLQEHAATGEEVTIATLVPTLRRLNLLNDAGGVQWISQLLRCHDVIPQTLDVVLKRVRANARRRRVHQIGVRLMEHAANESLDIEAVTAAALPKLAVAGVMGDGETTLAAEARAVQDALLEDTPTDVVGWPIAGLQRGVGGQRPGWLVVSGGWTSIGKSWFGLDCSEHALREGRRVLYATLEMPAREVGERMVARAGVDLGALQAGGFRRDGSYMPDAAFQTAYQRIEELQEPGQRMTILDGYVTVRGIVQRIAAAHAAGRAYRYVVIDTLNLLGLPKANSRREAIDAALLELKQAAVRYGVTMHVQAQLGRTEDKKLRAPRLQDYKESGGIEQIADVALFVHRERDPQSEAMLPEGVIMVAKARSSASAGGGARVRWDAESYRFVERVQPVAFGGAA
jgi:replicative DNA helicase